ncbi:MAG: cation diffusion facilitator family transporter [Candidatus Fimenecus sp.]
MAELLAKLFIKDYQNTKSPAVRAAYGELSGAVGICVNLLLSAAKFFVGTITGSISISADAVNNLSDAGSSVVTLVSFKLAKKPADKDHPYGHGRIEYIAALIVSFLILMMGFELFKSSVDKIRDPSPVTYSTVALVILLLSIAAKLWLAYFNHRLGKKIDSAATKAVVSDSLSDTAATTVALAALLLSLVTDFPVDGWFGIVVALFIFRSGAEILKDTVGLLLGKPPEKEFFDEIEQEILSYDGVVGVHDLIIHDYGPGRSFASVHAEVPANIDILQSHDTVDLIERDLQQKYGMLVSIHMDPVVTDDARVTELKEICQKVIHDIDERLTLHDFRMVEGPTHTNLIFDTVAPPDFPMSDRELCNAISEKLSKIDERYFAVITVDHAFN